MTMLSGYDDKPISAAESTRHSWDEERDRLTREHDIRVRQMELEVYKIETRWSILLRIPLTIIKLPVYIVMSLGYTVAMARKHDPGDRFWDFLR